MASRNAERWLHWLKVALLASWFGFACTWAIVWYLGFRIEGHGVNSPLMGMAKDMSGAEVTAGIVLPPLVLLVIGCLIVSRFARSGHEPH